MNFIRYLCMNFSVTMNSNIIKILFLAIITIILPVEAFAASPGSAAVSAPHVVILGDSNTSIGGDMCDNPKGGTNGLPSSLIQRAAGAMLVVAPHGPTPSRHAAIRSRTPGGWLMIMWCSIR